MQTMIMAKPAITGYSTIVFKLNFRLFFALVPIHVTPIQISSINLHDSTLLNTWKRAISSRMKPVTLLSAVTGRFITSSTIRKMYIQLLNRLYICCCSLVSSVPIFVKSNEGCHRNMP